MPTKSKSRGSKAKQAVAQARGTSIARNDPSMLIPGNIIFNVLPRMMRKQLRYAETFSLTTGTAGVIGTVQTMTLNNVYDPNQTGIGHQPYGFDQLTPFYGYYVVHSCRWRILATTIGNTSEVCVAYQIYPAVSGVSIAGISVDAATEKSAVSTFNVGPSGNDRSRMVTGVVQMPKVFGLSPPQYKDNLDQYGAAVTSGPAAGAYFEVGVGSYSGSAGVSLSVQIVLDYDVEFYSPKTLPQS